MASTVATGGQVRQHSNGQIGNNMAHPTPAPADIPVNRKKAKRRAKQAAKQAATNDHGHAGQNYDLDPSQYPDDSQSHLYQEDYDHNHHYEAGSYTGPGSTGAVYSDEDDDYGYDPNPLDAHGHSMTRNGSTGKSQKGKKRRKGTGGDYTSSNMPGAFAHQPPQHYARPRTSNNITPRAISDDALRTVQRGINSGIWNTSSYDERQRIKEYWLSLGEEERKALVKIEKNDVLKKMKDQQKHSCSCTVCGRKRVAIEEELEVLYDAYYQELEQYANHNQHLPDADPMLLPPPTRHYSGPGVVHPPNGAIPPSQPRRPARGRIQELPDDEDEEEDEEEEDIDGDELDPKEYSEDEYDEDEYSESADEHLPPAANEFFAFGKSLTVKGGILTVADDLLKNDGQKFIDMMEQLAERRMQREEAYYNPYAGHAPGPAPHTHTPHSHPPPEEDDEYDEDDEEYDSQEDDYDEDDEVDTMTESQRMDEGRRMFQIFAARMFEQRVLTAYREKRAMERQEAFLRDLEDEEKEKAEATSKNAAKKAKQRQKEKAKKEALKEEKARKDAEKIAADLAEEERKQDEKRRRDEENRKKEEERKKKAESARRAQEEEKARKKAEERERDEARKEKERRAREKKEREDAIRREREAKEREQKIQQEREEADRQEHARLEKEVQEQKRAAELHAQAAKSAQPSQPSQPVPTEHPKRSAAPAVVALPPTLKTKQSYTSNESPQVKIATPALPKPPTPVRPKEFPVPALQTTVPPVTPDATPRLRQTTSPKATSQQGSAHPIGLTSMRTPSTATTMASTPQMSPMHPIAAPPGMPLQHQSGPHMGVPQLGPNGYPAGPGPMMHGIMQQRMPVGHQMPGYGAHLQQQHGPPHRPFYPGSMGGAPPGIGAIQASQPARSFMPEQILHHPASTNAHQQYSQPREIILPPQHARQASVTFDTSPPPLLNSSAVTQPIARPVPAKRPTSTNPFGFGSSSNKGDVEEISTRLGSSALLDDSDEPLPISATDKRRTSTQYTMGLGMSNPLSGGLPGSPFEHPNTGAPFGSMAGNTSHGDSWRLSSSQYGPSATSGWGSVPNSGWGSTDGFMSMPTQYRSSARRPVTVRLLTCQACQSLARQTPGVDGVGFHDFKDIARIATESARQMQEQPLNPHEIRNILDTEGDRHNGGGSFIVREDVARARTLVKWVPSITSDHGIGDGGRAGLGLGEIGSPLPGNSLPSLGGLGARGF